MSEFYIGLMSGTSVDSVDAALLEFSDSDFSIRHALSVSLPEELRERVLLLANASVADIDEIGQLDRMLGKRFGEAANALLDATQVSHRDIRAIGSHGQTIRHRPALAQPFTMQLGDPNQIVHATGITTVADFRRRDMALGGQGAPLTPAFHQAAFGAAGETRAVVNLGGIANLTALSADGVVHGFDTGPGNVLLDRWIADCRGLPMDVDGRWASSGKVDRNLLEHMLGDPYFSASPPKSTGPEYFNLEWLAVHLQAAASPAQAADVQATLAELTATSVAHAVVAEADGSRLVLLCGGGSHNSDLVGRLARILSGHKVDNTALMGIDPDFVEAAAFAWLAKQTLSGLAGNVPRVTGAQEAAVLGAIYPA